MKYIIGAERCDIILQRKRVIKNNHNLNVRIIESNNKKGGSYMLGLLGGLVLGTVVAGANFMNQARVEGDRMWKMKRDLIDGAPPCNIIGGEPINCDTGGKIHRARMAYDDILITEYGKSRSYTIYNVSQRERRKNNIQRKALADKTRKDFYEYEFNEKLNKDYNLSMHSLYKRVDDDDSFYIRHCFSSGIDFAKEFDDYSFWSYKKKKEMNAYSSVYYYVNIETEEWMFDKGDRVNNDVINIIIKRYGEEKINKGISEGYSVHKICKLMREYIKLLKEYESENNRSYEEWKEVNKANGMEVNKRVWFTDVHYLYAKREAEAEIRRLKESEV